MNKQTIHKNRLEMVKYAQRRNRKLRKYTGNILIMSNLWKLTEDFTTTLRNGKLVRTRHKRFYDIASGYMGHPIYMGYD